MCSAMRDPYTMRADNVSPDAPLAAAIGEAENFLLPGPQRRLLLFEIIVALIDADDARARAGDVIEHRFGDFQAHPQPL